jgi:hypothetical protein
LKQKNRTLRALVSCWFDPGGWVESRIPIPDCGTTAGQFGAATANLTVFESLADAHAVLEFGSQFA